MKRMNRFLTALALGFLLTHFASGQQVLKLAGSTTCQLGFVDESASPFANASGIKLDIAGGGTGAGMKAVLAGAADIGMASRPLKAEETSSGLVATTVGWDAIAIIVNKQNTVENLTVEQLKDINTGKITNWKQVGGLNKPIIVVTSHGGSATKAMLQEEVMKGEPYSDKAIAVGTTRQEVDQVNKFPIAIGAVSTSFVDPRVRVIKIEGVEPTTDNVLAHKYPISRPLNLVTKGSAASNAKKYIDFILSESGQSIVAKKFTKANVNQ